MVKVKKYDFNLNIRVNRDIKEKAENIMYKKYNKSLSEYLREKIEELVKEEE